jgi:DNA-binding transcriptional LysR family regulator
MRKMEIKHLHSFRAVAEELSFINASRKLHISQPALSAQIQALEAELGVQLFARNRRSVRLTKPGEAFLRSAEAILQMTDEAKADVQRVAAGESGHLKIGFVASAALQLVPFIVLAFRRNHPRVTLDLLNIRTADQIAMLQQRTLDAGFLRLPSSSKDIAITPIHSERFVLVVPQGHRLAGSRRFSLKDLEHESFVAYGRRHAPGFYDRWIQIFTAAGFSPNVVQETGEMETMLAMVAAGLGIAVAPQGLVRRQVRNVAVRHLPSKSALSEIGLAVRSDHDDPLIHKLSQISRSLGRKRFD